MEIQTKNETNINRWGTRISVTLQPLSYINEYTDSGKALSSLRRKIDSLTIVFEGLATGSNWNQSALDGIWLLLRDLQQHIAMLDKE
jgi:hypothetical protein